MHIECIRIFIWLAGSVWPPLLPMAGLPAKRVAPCLAACPACACDARLHGCCLRSSEDSDVPLALTTLPQR